MDFISAIILGIVEGVTEFLPISSTGHLILASDFLQIEQTEFVKSFEIIIQSGAILAVIFLYSRTLMRDFELLKRIGIAFVPTAIIGFALYDFIKQYLIGNTGVVLAALFTGGIALILLELMFKNRNQTKSTEIKLSYEKAAAIGVFQAISMIPGVSRAAATIFGGMIVGLPRKQAVEFSFLLAVPTMIAATALDLRETSFAFSSNEWLMLAVGFVVSFIVAVIAIKWLLNYVQSHNFIAFGVYRIALSFLYFIFIFG